MLHIDRNPAPWRGVTLALGVLLVAAPACSIKKLAANKIGDAIASGGSTYETDDDLELVGDALPFSLKLIESLLSASPDHAGLLNAACKGFTSYGYAFVQNGDKALSDPDLAAEDAIKARARRLYLRALRYGLHGLDVTDPGLSERLTTDPKGAVAHLKKIDVERTYWAAASLGLAIAVSKSDAAMIARVPEVEAMLDRAFELDETWGAGSLHEFAITLASAKPGGADAAALQKHFERALALSGGNRASLFTTYAEAAAIPKQDVDAFRALVARALAVDVDARPEWRVANLAAQKRARWLAVHTGDFFLLPEDDAASSGGSR
jgi:predicted anti-sigma-YlaC factor YlaD